MQKGQHQTGCCQIIQIGRQEKSNDGDEPKKLLRATRAQGFMDKVKAAVIFQDFDYRHRT